MRAMLQIEGCIVVRGEGRQNVRPPSHIVPMQPLLRTIESPWVGLAMLALVLVALATHRVLRWRDRYIRRRIARAAFDGQRDARQVLRRSGYTIEDSEVQAAWTIEVNGQSQRMGLRADYLLHDAQGKRYVAEVKTGRLVPSLRHGATRRQLLEYRLAFAVEGVLLVDMARQRIDCVVFPLLPRPSTRTRWGGRALWSLLMIGVGMVLAQFLIDDSLH